MQTIEARIRLPAGAWPIGQYRRYYAFSNKDPDLVEAIYAKGGRPTRMWLNWDELPIIVDGGCSVIWVRYQVRAKRFVDLTCG
jgi:hypothetical protein